MLHGGLDNGQVRLWAEYKQLMLPVGAADKCQFIDEKKTTCP